MTALLKSVGSSLKVNAPGTNTANIAVMNRPLPVGLALAAALRKMPEPGRAILAPVARELETRR